VKLTLPDSAAGRSMCASLAAEFTPNGEPNPAFALSPDDPRLKWLIDYVTTFPRDKVVLLCADRQKAVAIAGALGERAALHHEALDLSARDDAVRRFSEKDGRGAHVLVCSEIGVEARSLPFAHHLVIFDLPPDPLRVQRRIGNLDRFGHMAKVRVHIPYIEGTPAEIVFRWFHEALHLFERPLPVVHACARAFAERFRAVSTLPPDEAQAAAESLLPEAQHHADELKDQLQTRRDRLTELASFRPLPAQRLLESVRRLDSDLSLDFLMLRLFDHFGFDAEDVGERTYNVRPREKDRNPRAFPDIETAGKLITFERQKALARDDLAFLTWDHAVVLDHVDLVLETIEGNSSYVVWEDLRSQIVLLEALFRVELAESPPRLYTTRFFSPAGVRLIVNHELDEVGAEYPMELINKNVRNGRRDWIRHNNGVLRELLPRLLGNLEQRARERAAELGTQAIAEIDLHLSAELDRLELLRRRGGPVTETELSQIRSEIDALKQCVAHPVVTLDSLRLVRRGPAGKGI
jgi:ATP-dependent helicase HepA